MRLINADALKKSICDYASEPVKVNDRRWNTKCKAIILDVIGTVEAAPTVEPKRGEWLDIGYYRVGIPRYTCNQCGTSVDMETPYCPNCGAIMLDGGDTE